MTTIGLPRRRVHARAEPSVPRARRPFSALVWLGYTWMTVIILLAVLAPILHLPSYATPIGFPRLGPDTGSLGMLLGTDGTGRSMLSRLIYGARVSLVVGAVACLGTFVLGTLLGLIAGWFGKWLDTGIGLLTDTMLAFPGIVLLLALSATFTPSVTTLVVGMAIMGLPQFIRLARAQTLSWSTRGFVRAARNMGAGPWRILFREILPNALPPLAAYLPVVLGHIIVAEGSLSFLGLGIPPPSPSWGAMVYAGKDSLADHPHLVFIPALAIFLTVFSLNQIGDHLRNRFDRSTDD